MKIDFELRAWEEYMYWQKHDKAIVKKINELIKDTIRSPYEGIGKPEPLRHHLGGYWSRRITSEHRFVYTIDGDRLVIHQCKYHY